MNRINAIRCGTLIYDERMTTKLTPGEWLEDQLARPDIALTQEQFGDAVGAAQPTVSAWIAGKSAPRRRTCIRIAEVLGLSRDDVFAVFGIARRDGQPVTFDEQTFRFDLHEMRRDLVDVRTRINAMIARIDAAEAETTITNG